MQILFTRMFLKDLEKLTDQRLKSDLKNAVEKFEVANNLFEMTGIKKLKGHKTAFRLRIGNYKIGFHFDNDCIKMTRFLKRDAIYDFFS